LVFKKGNIPWNKGKNLSESHIKNLSISHKGNHSSPKTQFKKGNVPWNKGLSGKDHPLHQVEKWIYKICPNCNKKFSTRKKVNKIYCCMECKLEYHRGKNHHSWKGIDYKYERDKYKPILKRLSYETFKRDNFTCQECGKVGCKLHCHHIKHWKDYPNLRFDKENLITLCEECHMNIHWG